MRGRRAASSRRRHDSWQRGGARGGTQRHAAEQRSLHPATRAPAPAQRTASQRRCVHARCGGRAFLMSPCTRAVTLTGPAARAAAGARVARRHDTRAPPARKEEDAARVAPAQRTGRAHRCVAMLRASGGVRGVAGVEERQNGTTAPHYRAPGGRTAAAVQLRGTRLLVLPLERWRSRARPLRASSRSGSAAAPPAGVPRRPRRRTPPPARAWRARARLRCALQSLARMRCVRVAAGAQRAPRAHAPPVARSCRRATRGRCGRRCCPCPPLGCGVCAWLTCVSSLAAAALFLLTAPLPQVRAHTVGRRAQRAAGDDAGGAGAVQRRRAAHRRAGIWRGHKLPAPAGGAAPSFRCRHAPRPARHRAAVGRLPVGRVGHGRRDACRTRSVPNGTPWRGRLENGRRAVQPPHRRRRQLRGGV